MKAKKKELQRVCAWCGKHMGTKPSRGGVGITSGICKNCQKLFDKDYRKRKWKQFLDSFSIPLLMVDNEGRVQRANNAALDMLGKEVEMVEGELCGPVLDCANAGLRGGCGKTVNCEPCAIRNAILQTFKTGEAEKRKRVLLKVGASLKLKKKYYYISTELVAGIVVLKI